MIMVNKPLVSLKPYLLRNTLLAVLAVILIIASMAYVAFQARHLLSGPQVFLEDMDYTVSTERALAIRGQAKNIVNISLNGKQIFTDKNGAFEEKVVLENGHTTAIIRAEDRYGRQISRYKEFVYIPPEETEADEDKYELANINTETYGTN